MGEQLRLADMLAALSVTTDLAMGQAPEKAIRATVVAVEIGRTMGLSDADLADVYYTTLLKHLGCTATSHEEADIFGPDDLGMRPIAERADVTNRSDMFALMRVTGKGAGLGRVRHLARAVTSAKETDKLITSSVCEVATRMSDRLGLGPSVARGLNESLERWDGKGGPAGLGGEDIATASRIAEPATQSIIFHRLGGPEAAVDVARQRSGGWFDPAVVEALRAVGPATLERLDTEDPWVAVLEAEPQPVRTIADDRLETVAEAFADMVDLKTPYTLGHSSAVAEVASTAAERVGSSDPRRVRLAGLFHDLGRAGVGAGVWEKRGPLTTSEWEQVRLHPYHSERILRRSRALEPLAKVAGMHHERHDGSGYHRGASAGEIATEARLLGVADTYQAMTQSRSHRAGLSPEQAAEALASEAKAGRLDAECVAAVVDAAGQRRPKVRTEWPAGLSDREVDVLRLVARGRSNKAIAADLFISARTAEHHVQHIYAKIGVSTRAGAAMFAMEHGLLRS